MSLNTEEVQILQTEGKISKGEQTFRNQLKFYQRINPEDNRLLEKTLLEKEQLRKFNQLGRHFSMNSGTVTFVPETINYYLERNFILNRYGGNYHYITLSSIHHMHQHYQLLLTRNFDEVSTLLMSNSSLKEYLADLYIETTRYEDSLVETIIQKHPEKVAEVASLLKDYNAYQDGLVRPEETVTANQIDIPFNGPYVYKKVPTLK